VVVGDHYEEKKSVRLDGPDDFHIEPSLIYHVCMGFPIQNIQYGTRSAAKLTDPPYWTETGIWVVSEYLQSRDGTENHFEDKSCTLLVHASNNLCLQSENACIATKKLESIFLKRFASQYNRTEIAGTCRATDYGPVTDRPNGQRIL